jgi:prepilin-type N-terminal cleavage/methylation domain-containing protein
MSPRPVTSSTRSHAAPPARPAPRHAFTLIELLVVIAVIVILAAITVPAVRGLTTSNNRSQALNVVRSYIAAARSLALNGHRMAGVVFFEESADYARPASTGQTAMQLFVEDYDQAQYTPLAPNTVFVAHSHDRQYLPPNIRVAVLNDDPARGVMTGDDQSAANTRGATRAILFNAQGQMITRTGLARPDLGAGAPGTYPRAYGDWNFTTKRSAHPNVGVSAPGVFLFDMNEYRAQNIPADVAGDAQRVAWIKQHADAVMVNAYTGTLLP